MRRTNTTTTQTFTLPPPGAATFEFDNQEYITIAIPEKSIWRMPCHWHTTTLDGKSIRRIGGHLHIAEAILAADGGFNTSDVYTNGPTRITFDITQHVSWESKGGKPLKVRYEANQALHRNICSAIIDREIYPKLGSTPIWISLVFVPISCIPSLKNWLLDRILGVQLDMIYYQHDFHIYYGSIMFQFPWLLFSWGHSKPPRWTLVAHVRSMYLISRLVMMFNYWFGRILLGMKGEYSEYTPSGLQATTS